MKSIKMLIMCWIFWFFCLVNMSFAYKELLIEKRGGRPIRVIKVVLDGEHFVVASPAKDGGETTEQLAKNVGGDTAINGAFFCPDDYSSCKIDGKRLTHTISERVFLGNGKDWSRFRGDTSIRMIFSFDKQGNPFFVQRNSWESDVGLRSNLNKDRLDDIYFGIGNFPVLLLEGDDVVQGFVNYIDKKMAGNANRNFICSTEDWTTIYMGVVGASSIRNLPAYLKKEFWCWNALSLDAGASTAMVYEGKTLDRGSRTRVMDAFVVLDREQYIKLTGITPDPKAIPKVQPYEPSAEDQAQFRKVAWVIDSIFKQYGKKKYQVPFIKIIRDMVNPELTPDKKWLYNQLLIHLFTIDSF